MENILVIDSGIGGLYTAKILKEKFPNFNYVYFKDTFNCPYGNKHKEELQNIAKQNINFVLKRYKIRAVVLACNTLSTNCINELKMAYNTPFFKVEPPINKITGNALVLCTKTCYNAIKSGLHGEEKFLDELTIFKTKINNKSVTLCAVHNLAYIIEHNLKNKQFVQYYLSKIFNHIAQEKFEQIIIGCTHYNYVKKELTSIFHNCYFVEGSDFINLNTL